MVLPTPGVLEQDMPFTQQRDGQGLHDVGLADNHLFDIRPQRCGKALDVFDGQTVLREVRERRDAGPMSIRQADFTCHSLSKCFRDAFKQLSISRHSNRLRGRR